MLAAIPTLINVSYILSSLSDLILSYQIWKVFYLLVSVGMVLLSGQH
jgi:hypothetical protein